MGHPLAIPKELSGVDAPIWRCECCGAWDWRPFDWCLDCEGSRVSPEVEEALSRERYEESQLMSGPK